MLDTGELASELDDLHGFLRDGIPLDDTEQARLAALEALATDVGDEFRHGVTLIPEDAFESYARQLAEDVGAISDDTRWPCTCIDWRRAADELAADYASVAFDGVDYYLRC